MRTLAALALAVLVLPLASGAGASSTFEAENECRLAGLAAVTLCEVRHSGELHRAWCEWLEHFRAEWCGVEWTLNGTLTGPDRVPKRVWVEHRWRDHLVATTFCGHRTEHDEGTRCDVRHTGLMTPLRAGACMVMLLRTHADTPAVGSSSSSTSRWVTAETRVELCRDAAGAPTTRVLE